MNDDRPLPPGREDLESRLRDHYRDAVGDSAGDILLTARIDKALDRPPTGARAKLGLRPRTRGAFGFRAFAGVVGVVAAFTAVVMIANLLLSGPPATAGPGPTGLPGAAGSPTPGPTSSPAIEITATPDPSGQLAGAIATSLGRMRSGGVWWTGPGWFGFARLTNGGSVVESWPISDTQPPATFVLDQGDWWTVSTGPGSSNAYAGQGQSYDHLLPVVNRLAQNSSVTWVKATVPGDYPDSVVGISFVDALTGFLMFSSRPPAATSTILRTDDGGATWKVVATPGLVSSGAPSPSNIGGMFAASDTRTLWAGAQSEGGGHGHPLLAVSRDGGVTWSEVTLPGLSGLVGGFDTALLEPPVFLDSNTGFVNVVGPNERVYMTTDAGRTWKYKDVPINGVPVDFVDAANWAIPDGSTVVLTADGGNTWKTAAGIGLPRGQFIKVAFLDSMNGYGLFQPIGDNHTYLYRTQDGGNDWLLQSSNP
jgi:photosystem II stability/assembly factor-like uncharacterized protein